VNTISSSHFLDKFDDFWIVDLFDMFFVLEIFLLGHMVDQLEPGCIEGKF